MQAGQRPPGDAAVGAEHRPWTRETLSVLPTRAKCQCLVPPAQSSELPAVAAARGLVMSHRLSSAFDGTGMGDLCSLGDAVFPRK